MSPPTRKATKLVVCSHSSSASRGMRRARRARASGPPRSPARWTFVSACRPVSKRRPPCLKKLFSPPHRLWRSSSVTPRPAIERRTPAARPESPAPRISVSWRTGGAGRRRRGPRLGVGGEHRLLAGQLGAEVVGAALQRGELHVVLLGHLHAVALAQLHDDVEEVHRVEL